MLFAGLPHKQDNATIVADRRLQEMEVKEAVYKRQSIRKYKDKDVAREDLLEILDAARVAPSGSNCQNWHFVVMRSRDIKEKIAGAIVDKNEEIASVMDKKDPEKGLRFRKFVKNFTLFFLNAPVLIAVYATYYPPSGREELIFAEYPQEDIDKLDIRSPGMQNIGAALENMNLRAIDLGYGACFLTGQNYATDEIEAVLKKEAGFEKKDYFLACMFCIGVPEEGARSPKKKELSEICTFLD